MAEILSAEEIERADRFRFARHRRRHIVAHSALRLILGGYTAVPPTRLTFQQNSYGKPALPDGPSFNLSHSGELALIAVAAPGRAVGIDVERRHPHRDLRGIARRFFSPAEQAALAALPTEAQETVFYDIWTRKEAYIKAEGVGLALGLDTFDVSVAPGEPARLLATRPDPTVAELWSMTAVPIDPGYAAALVAAGRPLVTRFWNWSG